MSDQPQLDDREALLQAIQGNEAEVAELLERLDEINDLLDILALGSAAADDEMVVMLAETANNIGTLADSAIDPPRRGRRRGRS